MIDRSLNYGRHLIKKFLAEASPYQVVLDIGAGHGDDLRLAREIQTNAKFIAFEVYPPYVEELTQENVEVYPVNIERDKFPLADESVDIIIGNQIFEHCKEVWWLLHEISRVLRVGGKLIIGVPNLASLHNRFLLLLGRQPTCIQNNSAHVRGYTRKDLLKLLDSGFEEGYSLKKFGGSNYYPFPRSVARPLAGFFPGSAWGIFLMVEKKKKYNDGYLEFPLEEKLETNFYLGT